jgi:hypothetical protein
MFAYPHTLNPASFKGSVTFNYEDAFTDEAEQDTLASNNTPNQIRPPQAIVNQPLINQVPKNLRLNEN